MSNSSFGQCWQMLMSSAVTFLICLCLWSYTSETYLYDYTPGVNTGNTDYSNSSKAMMLFQQPGIQECSRDDININLTETSNQQCLVYNMVPKCGSAGMRQLFRALTKQLGYTAQEGLYSVAKGHIISFNHQKEGMADLTQHVQDRCSSSESGHVYFRHQHFADFNLIGLKTPYFTNLIRDPVDHYISWYYYRRYGGSGANLVPTFYRKDFYQSEDSEKIKNMTFDECVQSNNIECMNSTFTFTTIPYFCGYEDFCLEPTEKALEQAKINVIKYYPVVGYIENFTQYMELCAVVWPQFYKGAVETNKNLKQKNVSSDRKKYEPSQDTKRKMADRLEVEYKFYNWVKRRFQCIYDMYVKNNVK